jgi:formyltetrahydrofolate synthetase
MIHADAPHSVTPRPIMEVGEQLGLATDEVLPYGPYKAKVALSALDRLKGRSLGRYVLVTAINPTPLGEGKTTHPSGWQWDCAVLGTGRSSRCDSLRWDRYLASKAEAPVGGEPRSFPWTK